MSDENIKEQQIKLIQIVRETIERDEVLRQKYRVESKFRFIRERLESLLSQLEQDLALSSVDQKELVGGLNAGEIPVYVYIYNAQGAILKSWQNMLTPKVFYEYSVNRPIYTEKNVIESVVRSKKNKSQHAYLTIAINPNDLIQLSEEMSLKDLSGNPIVKVREGSLHFNRLLVFTHAEQDYTLNERGEFVRKE